MSSFYFLFFDSFQGFFPFGLTLSSSFDSCLDCWALEASSLLRRRRHSIKTSLRLTASSAGSTWLVFVKVTRKSSSGPGPFGCGADCEMMLSKETSYQCGALRGTVGGVVHRLCGMFGLKVVFCKNTMQIKI